MLHRIRHQAILLDRFWESIRNDARHRRQPPAGLNPEIAELAVRLSSESRAMTPTAAFRADLRAQIKAATPAAPQQRVGMSLVQTEQALADAAFVADDERTFTRRHPASELAVFLVASLVFIVVGALLVALFRDTGDDATLGTAATVTPTVDSAMGVSIPPEVPVQIKLNSGRPSWGMAIGAESIWIGTGTDDGSAVVRAAQTGRLGGEVQATIPQPGRVWDVAYGHGAIWATVIGDSISGEDSALVRIDPATNAITETIPIGAQPTYILVDDAAVWVTDIAEPTVWRVDPATSAVAATIELGDPSNGGGAILVNSGDDLWALVSSATGAVEALRIDQNTNTVAARTALPESGDIFGVVATTSGTFWIGTMTNSLLRFDAWTGEIVDRIELPGQPRAILADDDYVWVATLAWSVETGERIDAWRNALVLIDVPSGHVHTIHDLHDDVPWAVAVGDDPTWGNRVWISLNSEADQQARLRGERRPSGISFDTTTPTATAFGLVATAVASPTSEPSPSPVPPTSTPEPTPTVAVQPIPAGEITATFEFTGGLGQPVWGADALWVPNFTIGVIERIDGATGETTRIEISRPGEAIDGVPIYLAADDNAIWASDNAANELVRIDPVTYEVLARIPLGDIKTFPAWIESIAVGEGAVWVILDDNEIVVRIDPATNTVAAVIDAPGARSMAVGLGAVWVHNVYTAEIMRLDPATNEIVNTIPTGPNQFTIMSMAIAGGRLWVEGGGGSIHEIDPATNSIVASMSTGIAFEPGHLAADAGDLAADDSAVWAVYEIPSLVVRFDPVTLETRTLDINVPHYVSIGGGSVWVTTAAGSPNTVVRIEPTP